MNNEHSAMLQTQLSQNASLCHEMQYNSLVQQAEYNLVSLLKPKIYKDGNQWCVLYGENLQDGIAGFGDTPYLAILDFNKNWNKN